MRISLVIYTLQHGARYIQRQIQKKILFTVSAKNLIYLVGNLVCVTIVLLVKLVRAAFRYFSVDSTLHCVFLHLKGL